MTRAERRLYERLRRRAARMQPELARRMMTTYEIIRRSLTPSELVEAISAGHVERMIAQLLGDEPLDRALASLRALIDQNVIRSAQEWTRDLPGAIHPPAFNALNPRIIDAVRQLDTRVIRGLKDEIRETVRNVAREGIQEGATPATIARRIRDAVGLAPNQSDAVSNFRRMLEQGDSTALTRKLRDRRFDGTLRRALGPGGTGLTREQVDKMTEAYRRRMLAFNAQTHARTIANDSHKLAQRLSWENAVEMGVVDRKRLRKTWISTGDSRVRPSHRAMHGETVGFDETYSNGQWIPGDSEYNCRCIERITLGEYGPVI